MRKVCVHILILAALSGGAVPASGRTADLAGRIEATGKARLDDFVVEMTRLNRGRTHAAEVDLSGQFRFQGIVEGDYTLRVRDRGGRLVHQETAQVGGPLGFLTVFVEGPSGEQPVSGMVSLERLGHKPSRKAQQELRRGQQAFRKGDHKRALVHYQRAVELDDDWYDAHLLLGMELNCAGSPADAVPHLERALDMDPYSAAAYWNLSVSWILLADFQTAEQAARRSIALDPLNSEAHYLLGYALTRLGRGPEAIRELERAGADVPAAQKLLKRIAAAGR